MKKIIFLAISVMLMFLVIGCNVNARNTVANNASSNLSNDSVIDKQVALDNATGINVEVCAAEVNINSYDGEDVKIAGKLSDKSKGFDINKIGNEIEIVEKGYELFGSLINTEANKTKINISIPSKFNGNFTFKQGAGTSKIEGIKVKKMDITGGAGELNCGNIRFDKLDLKSGVGKVDLNLNDKCGDIDIIGGVGEVRVKMTEVGGNFRYNGGVGETNITIPQNAPVKFLTHKGVGKCEINATTSNNEMYTFDLKVGVGAINVRN
ncbi:MULTISPECIES: DUF4097 family beta strand repeat-containing protein [unclassified Clostridium]|uniref:DUF4097 family beta strand repeat-containing protein n=1 Tax=unclassified Clostridium TaxID=2614128 RepID=UPI000297267F|nr:MULTISPECIES: DUF4097 family beta strand repeat-containing protein [unclassified Clostridium]EKQ57931.1 MAG: hypothetical protein A370_00359 [Clostridium sp. Maddingley MBC34-26]